MMAVKPGHSSKGM